MKILVTPFLTAVLLLSGLLAPQSSASAQDSCSGQTCVARITRIYLNSHVRVQTSGDMSALSCGADSYLRLPSDHPLFREIYTLLLTAANSNKPVRIRVVQGSDPCDIQWVMQDH